MSWKNLSEQVFSYPYFKQLFRRYLWLIYVPLGIFLGFVFLCGVLGLPLAVLGIILFPYAVFIVPSTALMIFHVYTQKTEASHLFSMPITRTQNFISTYLAGLLLILIPLMVMSLFYSLSGVGSNMIFFIMTMFFLAVIYYTYSVLGCLLGGTLATQLMMIGIISFGPLMLYVIINACVSSLALGNMPAAYNPTIVNIFCPLLSGIEFAFWKHWSYWYCHVILFVGMMAMCIYLIRIRPFELSGQPVIFPILQNYLMRPVLYLNAVYLIFFLCSTTIFQGSYFNTAYYRKMVILLACTGILVAFVLNIWFSRDLKTLFGWENFQRIFLMTLLSCSLFLIPLRQRENSRKDYSNSELMVTLTFPEGSNSIRNNYYNQRKIDRLLNLIDDSRNILVRNSTVNGEYACTLSLTFLNDAKGNTMSQDYYILPDDMTYSFRNFFQELIISGREDELDFFINGYSDPYYRSGYGDLYDRTELAQAMSRTFSKVMPMNYFEIYESQSGLFYNDYDALSKDFQSLSEIYVRSLTSDDFETWLQGIYSQVQPILTASEMNEIYETAQKEQAKGRFYALTNTAADEVFANAEDVFVDDLSQWCITEANDHYLRATISLNVTMSDNVVTQEATYFAGNIVAVSCDVSFEKVDQYWEMSVLDLREVSY